MQQSTFFINFKIKNKIPKDVKNLLSKTKLDKKTNPIVVFTGIKDINLDKISNSKLSNIQVYLYEPLSFYYIENNKKIYNRCFYSEVPYTKEYIENLYSPELDEISRFAQKLNQTIEVYTCDFQVNNFFQQKYKNLKLFCKDLFLDSYISFDKNQYTKKINYKFWCGNWRYTVHRHLIMCHLSNKSGKYSWHFNTKFLPYEDELSNYNFDVETLKQANEYISNTNLSLDCAPHKINVKQLYDVEYTNDTTIRKNKSFFLQTYRHCFCAVVNETRFGQPTANISEKTINAIQTMTPFVLVAPPYSLVYLKKLGFKTFDQFWNESYDTTEDHFMRMKKIFDLIDFIDKKSLHELEKIYADMQEILMHNANHLNFLAEKKLPILL